MARIMLGSYMIRYPLGGMMSWVLQYLLGFQRLGHEIYFVEKSGYPNACYDPSTNTMGDDCTCGARILDDLLSRHGMENTWCFVDQFGHYHGIERNRIESLFASADLFIDMGTHGAWMEEAQKAGCRVLIDGEPGFTQMKMEQRRKAGEALPQYDAYYTTGQNIGTAASTAPDAGVPWCHLFHPVFCDVFDSESRHPGSAFTTIMNWQSYAPLHYRGETFGHKDLEFAKFIDLPTCVSCPLEIAVSGKQTPVKRLKDAEWTVRDAHSITRTFDSFRDYIWASRGEFSVCKNGYVQTHSGWFSDRSAAYLASGRPVVMQDTGFGAYLPCGQGLFAISTLEEAAEAIQAVTADYGHHARGARDIAREHLEAHRVLGKFLYEIGL